MPHVVAIWVAGVVGGALAGTAGIVAGVAAGWTAYAATALAISYALGAVTQALTGRPKGLGGSRFRDVTIKATTAPRAIIYGEATTGAVLVFDYTTGLKNEYLDFVCVIAGHQIESITDVWFDDVKIVNADIGGGAAGGGAVAGTGDYRVRDGHTVAYIYKYLGTAGQTASPQLIATDGTGYPGIWTADHRGRGCAYVHIRLRRNEKAYGNGAPSNFKFHVKGAKVYDPRLDSTNGGSGSHRLTDASTWAWSNNPALCVADYIVGGTLTNDIATPVRKRGFGAPTTDVDWPSVITAANICDEDCAIPTSTTQNRYECDGQLVPSDDNPDFDCMDQLLTSMLGNVTYTNGTYIVYAGAYQSPTYTLTEADLAGSLQYVTGKGRSERYNYVRGTRFDSELGQGTEFLSRTDSSYVTADGRTLYHDIELPMTSNEYRAQRIAQTILRRSREQQTLIWPGMPSCGKIAVWETVRITVAELGISSKVFRCIARKQRPGSTGEPIIELTLREENSSTYTDPVEADYGSISVATDPGPVTGMLDPPANLVGVSSPNGITFTITPDDGAGTAEVYDLYEYTASSPFASATKVWSGNATVVFLPKTDTTARYYWVKARRYQYESDPFPATYGIAVGSGSVSSGLTASASVSSQTTSTSSSSATSASVTVTASGGTPTYTYAWTKLSGGTISITSASAASTTFSATSLASGESRTAVMQCAVTDSAAATFNVVVTITIARNSFSVTLDHDSLFKAGSTAGLTTNSVTATPVGGTSTYAYAWTKVSGGSISITSASAATTTFSAAGLAVDESRTAVFRVTVTDSTGGTPLTATADVSVVIERISYA